MDQECWRKEKKRADNLKFRYKTVDSPFFELLSKTVKMAAMKGFGTSRVKCRRRRFQNLNFAWCLLLHTFVEICLLSSPHSCLSLCLSVCLSVYYDWRSSETMFFQFHIVSPAYIDRYFCVVLKCVCDKQKLSFEVRLFFIVKWRYKWYSCDLNGNEISLLVWAGL